MFSTIKNYAIAVMGVITGVLFFWLKWVRAENEVLEKEAQAAEKKEEITKQQDNFKKEVESDNEENIKKRVNASNGKSKRDKLNSL